MESSCRLCLQDIKNSHDVFQLTKGDQMFSIIETITSIKIEPKDSHSKIICGLCVDTLEKAYELRLLSIKNDQHLKEHSISSDIIDLIKYEPEESLSEDDHYSSSNICSLHPELQLSFSDEPYQCDQCGELVGSKQAMKYHLQNNHLMKFCSLCHEQFSSADLLSQHMHSTHLTEGFFNCDLCNLRFTMQDQLEAHKEIHANFSKDDEGTYNCRHCSQQYDKICEVMFEHMKNHKKHKYSTQSRKGKPRIKRIREDSESLVCPQCGQLYRTKQILQQHIKRHFDTGDKYPCGSCPQKFKSWGELYYHSAVHTTERNFICELCSKTFKAKRDLRNHKIRHETKDVKKFQCSYCKTMLKNKYTLSRHILIHTGEKPHACTYCEKAFTQKNELNKHLRTHIGENTYRCDEVGCSEAFRLLAELRLHQTVHFVSQKSCTDNSKTVNPQHYSE